ERGDLITGFAWLPLQVASAIHEIWSQLQAAAALGGGTYRCACPSPVVSQFFCPVPGLGSCKLIVTLEQCHDPVY
ncbi:hypothetical protein ACQP3C_28245, partial [Escherichia coli]